MTWIVCHNNNRFFFFFLTLILLITLTGVKAEKAYRITRINFVWQQDTIPARQDTIPDLQKTTPFAQDSVLFLQDTIPPPSKNIRIRIDSIDAVLDSLKQAQDSLANSPYSPSPLPTFQAKDRFGDPFSNFTSTSPLLLKDPSALKMDVEIDTGMN